MAYSNAAKAFADLRAANPNLPIPEFLSLDEVKEKRALLSDAIFKDWHELGRILELHEGTIRKRWMKKHIRQRHAVLQNAYPSIPSQHRPDFSALEQESLDQRIQGSRFRDVYLLPEINLEDLSKPKNLLLLLNSRGRNPPDVFIFNDLEKVELGRTGLAVVPPYVANSTMYFTGQRDAQTYGTIASWNEDYAWEDSMIDVAMQPGEGLVALEAQQKMMSFLLKCAKSITHDLPLDGEPIPEPPPLEDPQIDAELSSVAAYATGTSYRIPIQFDFHHLKRLAEARIEQAQDHLWSLREDPSYFRDVILEYSEHVFYRVPTIQGDKHPELDSPGFWEDILTQVVLCAYSDAFIWSEVRTELEELELVRARFKDDISSNRKLPKMYERDLCHFQWFLQRWMKTPMLDLRTGAFASPPLRKYFHRLNETGNNTIICPQCLPTRSKLIPLIERLLDDVQGQLMGRHNILDVIDRVIRSENNENANVTPWVLNHLADVSIFSEFLRQLDFHKPRIGFANDSPDVENRCIEQYYKVMEPLEDFASPFLSSPLGLADVGRPIPSRFAYVTHKKLTKVAVGELRKAEAELDAFWQKVDETIKQRCGKTPNETMKDCIGQREIERTPEWVEPLTGCNDSSASHYTAMEDKLALLELQNRTESTVGQDRSPTRPKEKVKTRRTAAGADGHPAGGPAVGAVETCPPPHSPILVPRRAYKTLMRVFHTPSPDRVPGEVSWMDFLHAMTSAGCTAKRLMGSAWMFTFSESDSKAISGSSLQESDGANEGRVVRSVIIHEPHPAPNIPIHQVRKHGRRLARRWGWNIDMFAVEA
ncbi:hypothetical protein GYMLUDRAFT_36279 [Collybiopsis luxurians FD-317 M1]|nr:hypothetical protein GYMLUDRAFT_36279 [Collybiopsis luxurians FD-317 M1]